MGERGPKGSFRNRKVMTITTEEYVAEFFDKTTFMPGKALQEWVDAQVPKGTTWADYIEKHYSKEMDELKYQKDHQIHEIEKQYEEKISDLRRKKELSGRKAQVESNALREIWKAWREFKPEITKPNPSWKDDYDEVGFFVSKGHPITFADVFRLWPEMEGDSS